VKLITGAGQPLDGRLLLYDALGAEVRTIRLGKRENCPVCAGLRHRQPGCGKGRGSGAMLSPT
jgi:molybdopterin/thiamine biosynthesis adenylyltransferase